MAEPVDPNAAGGRSEIELVIAEVIQRRAAGESVPDEALIAAHSELMPELERCLKLLPQLDKARIAAQRQDTAYETNERTGQTPLPGPVSIPGYSIREEIARGGQAVVYLAIEERFGIQKAIKVFDAYASLQDIERSARVLATLNENRQIVGIFDYGALKDGRPYLVTEYIPGRRLNEFLRDFDARQPGYLSRVVHLFLRITSAVSFAHKHGAIHRDLKPANILVEPGGGADEDVPYLLDFDLVRTAASFEPGGGFIGSLPWAAPEQAAGRPDEVDTSTDVYSLGVLLYYMITAGRYPYLIADESGRMFGEEQVCRKIIHDPPIPPSVRITEFSPGSRPPPVSIPPDLERIVLKCLAKRQADRYQSAGVLADDVADFLAGLRPRSFPAEQSTSAAASPLPAAPPKPKEVKQRRVPVFARVALGLMLACALGEIAGVFAPVENLLYDIRVRYCQTAMRPPTTQIVHVDIDDDALKEIGADPGVRSWPWPRSFVAEMMTEISAAGPKVVFLDVFFGENSRPEQPLGTTRPIDHDQILGDAITRAGNVMVPFSLTLRPREDSQQFKAAVTRFRAKLQQNPGELSLKLRTPGFNDDGLGSLERAMREEIQSEMSKGQTSPDEIATSLLPKVSRDDPLRQLMVRQYDQLRRVEAMRRFSVSITSSSKHLLPHADGELPPILEISRGAAFSGFTDYMPQEGGVLRTVPLLANFRDEMYPHLGLALACVMLDANLAEAQVRQDKILLNTPRGELAIPVSTQRVPGTGNVNLMFDIPYLGRSDRWETMYDYPHHAAAVNRHNILVVWDAVKARRERDKAREELVQALPRDLAMFLGKTPADAASNAVAAAVAREPDQANNGSAGERDRRATAFARWHQSHARYEEHHHALANVFGGRAVLVGWIATGAIADSVSTPLHARCPGVVVVGAIANGIMSGELWARLPWWSNASIVLAAGMVALLLSMLLLSVSSRPLLGVVCLLALMILFAGVNGFWWFDRLNCIVPMASPLACMALVSGVVILARFRAASIERAQLAGRFSKSFVRYLQNHPDLVKIDQRKQNVTTVFTDLAGFTAMVEKDGTASVAVLNDYVAAMAPIIERHQGYLNKLLGDGLLFFFGTPIGLEPEDQALQAIRTVFEMHEALKGINLKITDPNFARLEMRAGITSGTAVVGDIGPKDPYDFTALGDVVNIAARLEAANKAIGTKVLVNQAAAELIKHEYLVCPLPQLELPGRLEPVTAAWVIGKRDKTEKRHVSLEERFVEKMKTFLTALQKHKTEEIGAILQELRGLNFAPKLVARLQRLAEERAGDDPDAPLRITNK